jgi:predicted acyl esterase
MPANEPPGNSDDGLIQHGDAQIVEQERCIIERHIYSHDGRRLVAWIMRPKSEGPFPVVVWNHGSRILVGADRALVATPESPTIDFASPCAPTVVEHSWLILFPEGRGYGGSEGPNPLVEVRRFDTTLAMLQGRANDANAAVEWLGFRLIKSTMRGRRQGRPMRDSCAPAYRTVLRHA